jgi:hypothetical protein
MHTNRHSPQSEGGAFVRLDWDLSPNPAKQALKDECVAEMLRLERENKRLEEEKPPHRSDGQTELLHRNSGRIPCWINAVPLACKSNIFPISGETPDVQQVCSSVRSCERV